MSTDLARRETQQQLSTLNAEQVELVKRTIAKNATDDELALFLNVCQRTGLDPFARQIFLIPRWDSDLKRNVMVPQVSIDGARLTAERTRQYRPGTTYYYDAAGKESKLWLAAEPPAAARVTVFKGGVEVSGIPVRYDERVQLKQDGSPRAEWKRQPAHMLAKCAEMATLRQAFPHDLSGLYVEGEGEEKPVTIHTVVEEEFSTDEQQVALADELAKVMAGDVSADALDARMDELYGTHDLTKLTRPQADELLEKLKGGGPHAA